MAFAGFNRDCSKVFFFLIINKCCNSILNNYKITIIIINTIISSYYFRWSNISIKFIIEALSHPPLLLLVNLYSLYCPSSSWSYSLSRAFPHACWISSHLLTCLPSVKSQVFLYPLSFCSPSHTTWASPGGEQDFFPTVKTSRGPLLGPDSVAPMADVSITGPCTSCCLGNQCRCSNCLALLTWPTSQRCLWRTGNGPAGWPELSLCGWTLACPHLSGQGRGEQAFSVSVMAAGVPLKRCWLSLKGRELFCSFC